MAFSLPAYRPPDFGGPPFKEAPLVGFAPVRQIELAPENYHATTIFPEYYQVKPGHWVLPTNSRMDCVVVQAPDVLLAGQGIPRPSSE
jgi:hypothetical protein